MRVYHGARNTAVAEGLLDGQEVIAFLIQRGSKRMTKRVDGEVLINSGGIEPLFK